MLTQFQNAPEKPDFKAKLVADIDAHLPAHGMIASSSSGIPSSQFIGQCIVDPSRVLIGHPFNPPHLIPLVEIVPHPGTSPAVVQRTTDFYKQLGKSPVVMKKEAPGFLANRIQAAVLCEAYSLVSRGIASPEDVDTAVSTGPGLRWALAGPFMTNVLGGGGGEDGFSHFMSHLGQAVRAWKQDMDENAFSFQDSEVKALNERVKAFATSRDPKIMQSEMAEAVTDIVRLKSRMPHLD